RWAQLRSAAARAFRGDSEARTKAECEVFEDNFERSKTARAHGLPLDDSRGSDSDSHLLAGLEVPTDNGDGRAIDETQKRRDLRRRESGTRKRERNQSRYGDPCESH